MHASEACKKSQCTSWFYCQSVNNSVQNLDNDKGVSDNLLYDLKGNGKCEEINEIHEGQ